MKTNVKNRSLYFVAKEDAMIGTFLQFICKEDQHLEFITLPEPITIFNISIHDFERGVIEGKYEFVQRVNRKMYHVLEAEYNRLKEIENAKYQ